MRTICIVLALPLTSHGFPSFFLGVSAGFLGASVFRFLYYLATAPSRLDQKLRDEIKSVRAETEKIKTETQMRLALVRSTAWIEIAQAILAESSNEYHKETAESLLRQIDANNVALKGML